MPFGVLSCVWVVFYVVLREEYCCLLYARLRGWVHDSNHSRIR
jgi:hypothetical protein